MSFKHLFTYLGTKAPFFTQKIVDEMEQSHNRASFR